MTDQVDQMGAAGGFPLVSRGRWRSLARMIGVATGLVALVVLMIISSI